jgi:pSer/pThr/pTyr-binding forkhead associated (FHA) protein
MYEYISHRLAVGGHKGDSLFDDSALDIIYRYTGGVPRLINTLCDTALLCAFADNKHSVGTDEIMAAIDELDWQEHESTTGRYKKLQQLTARRVDDTAVTRIEVRTDGEQVSLQTLAPGRVIVGRSPDNEIYIQSKFVSRHHAQIVSDEDGCVIEDLNSTNGLFLGEQQIKKHRLRDGDIVTIGVHELVYTDLRNREPANEDELPTIVENGEEDTAVGE